MKEHSNYLKRFSVIPEIAMQCAPSVLDAAYLMGGVCAQMHMWSDVG